jgi:transposase-like protein
VIRFFFRFFPILALPLPDESAGSSRSTRERKSGTLDAVRLITRLEPRYLTAEDATALPPPPEQPPRNRRRASEALSAFQAAANRGVSQRQFSRDTGVSRTTLQYWLARKKGLDADPAVVAFRKTRLTGVDEHFRAADLARENFETRLRAAADVVERGANFERGNFKQGERAVVLLAGEPGRPAPSGCLESVARSDDI